MPRLLHMADVHLGARHDDLGDAAAQQRERQFAAYRRAVDIALERAVDLVLISGDLFDSNHQPRRSVDRAVGELTRLTDEGIRVVLIPGTHDCYEAGSIYRVFDLPALAGLPAGSDLLTVLTPDRSEVAFDELDTIVHGRVFATKRAPESPLAGFTARDDGPRWRIGLIHGSVAVPGRFETDDVLVTEEEIAASGLDYLALGHWHSFRQGRAGSTTWAYAGAPEPVAVDQDGAGQVVVVGLSESQGTREVRLEPVAVGRTTFRKLQIQGGDIDSQDELVRRLREEADPDLVLDVRLVGVLARSVDLHEDEVTRELAPSFLRFRLRNMAVPELPAEPLPPADTIVGAFIRDLEARIAAAEAAGSDDVASETRDALHLGRLLMEDPQRVTLV